VAGQPGSKKTKNSGIKYCSEVSNKFSHIPMKSNRRNFIRTMGAGATGLAFGTAAVTATACTSTSTKKEEEDGQVLLIGDNIAVADTQYGKVRGYQLRGIFYYLGIPYGSDTSGPNRFMPPQKPKPWTEIFPAVWWGNSALELRRCKRRLPPAEYFHSCNQ
jgi:para-nitrobenzyl esterase